MAKTLIEEGYRVTLPPEVQPLMPIGTPLQITIDKSGRIILIPEDKVQAVLLKTFGMWADRQDVPPDGLAYMDEVRAGQRLDQLELNSDEAN